MKLIHRIINCKQCLYGTRKVRDWMNFQHPHQMDCDGEAPIALAANDVVEVLKEDLRELREEFRSVKVKEGKYHG